MNNGFPIKGTCDWCSASGIPLQKYKNKYICKGCLLELKDYAKAPNIEKKYRQAKKIFKTF